MYRTHTCGALRASDEGQQVTLAGWVAKIRRMGAMTFLDLRDRYGITQIFFDESHQGLLSEVGREWVLAVTGTVRLRSSVNEKIPTGQIEILADRMEVLNRADTPPFTIEDVSDGGDDLRMKYRYLDLRRRPVLSNIELRHRMTMETRRYLDGLHFLEIETPMLIGSTPEGARDFVVPSRMNPGQFYALPQSPQTFKQLLMVAGMDRYFQIVKCFRDEDLRADRQPEFTQIDCEMSFVEQDDILSTFEGLAKHLFKEIRGIDLPMPLRRMTWYEAMDRYGSDKPDLRFGMEIEEVTETIQGHGFGVVDSAAYIGAIVVTGKADYTRKQIDQLTDFVKRPQVGAKGLLWLRYQPDGTMKSSFDKFLDADQLKALADKLSMQPGDIAFLISGDKRPAQKQLGTLRLHVASELGLMQPGHYECLWVVDFPLLEWDEETQRYYAMHHPFTAPKPEDQDRLESDPGSVRADAYDMVINGVEVGGGSIRIHDAELQARVFAALGFTKERAEEQFGFLMSAFKYGAPPHGGIAFPKNNSGRDVMIDAPARLDPEQLDELHLTVRETL